MLETILVTMAQHHHIDVSRENDEWFAEDPVLGVSGNGETKAQALSQLAEAIARETGEISVADDFDAAVRAGERQIDTGDTHSSAAVRRRLGIDD